MRHPHSVDEEIFEVREVYYLKLPDWIFKNQKDQHSSTIERELKQVGSVICVAYLQYIPINEDELMTMNYGQNYAIFYSLWSNKKGQGKIIVQQMIQITVVYVLVDQQMI